MENKKAIVNIPVHAETKIIDGQAVNERRRAVTKLCKELGLTRKALRKHIKKMKRQAVND